MNIRAFSLAAFFICSFLVSAGKAEIYSYNKDTTIVGAVRTYKIKDNNESLIELARMFGLGYNEIADANPGLDSFIPGKDSVVNLPTAWILPDVPSYNGIVINLSEMRLYYFFKQMNSSTVLTFPIGIGSEGNNTPIGRFRIVEKIVKPSWHVPESIMKERPELPKIVPPGPDNPLGSHALRLSSESYLIHGTNKPWAVGRRATHGCIRLYPEDIPKLFALVSNGAPVTIIQQPVKVGTKNNRTYIEVHNDDHAGALNYFDEAVRLLTRKHLLKNVSTEKLCQAISDRKGIPVDISN